MEQQPKLLDQVRHKIRLKHYSIRTEDAYTDWVRRFVLYHAAGIRATSARRTWRPS